MQDSTQLELVSNIVVVDVAIVIDAVSNVVANWNFRTAIFFDTQFVLARAKSSVMGRAPPRIS